MEHAAIRVSAPSAVIVRIVGMEASDCHRCLAGGAYALSPARSTSDRYNLTASWWLIAEPFVIYRRLVMLWGFSYSRNRMGSGKIKRSPTGESRATCQCSLMVLSLNEEDRGRE